MSRRPHDRTASANSRAESNDEPVQLRYDTGLDLHRAGRFLQPHLVASDHMFNLFFPLSEMQDQAEASSELPWIVRLIFANIQLYFAGFFVVSVVTLIASVGLLRRWNWARLTFIGLMVLGIFWNIGSLLVQQLMFQSISFPSPRTDAPHEFSRNFEAMATVLQVFSVVMAVALSALFGWIIWRLASKPIAAEFRS